MEETHMTYRIGIDIGGTFTDFALFDDDRRETVTYKALTTPGHPERAVLEGIRALAGKAGVGIRDVSMVVHGTTLVTNAAIERRGAPTAMIVTRGFRDVLDIAMEQRYDLYDMRLRFPEPLVPRNMRFEIDERVAWDGSVRRPLVLDGLASQLDRAVSVHGVRAVAVCLMHSYANDTHEQAVGAWLAERFPKLRVSLSSVVFPFAREYQRWTSTCLNAYVQPLVDDYIDRLERGLAEEGFQGTFLVMSSSGSTLTPAMARRFPVRMLESGPAAGALMAARQSRWIGRPQILAFDMGGTTAKGCVVRDHAPLKRYEFEVARTHEFKRGSGLPIKIPVIDMIEIGAGGGSLAGMDARGVLQVGPRSASADPGPACYGRGGTEPTLTDANLVLGYLDPGSFLGGRMQLNVDAAREAIGTRVAGNLGVSLERAAWGIHEVINEDVAKAFRVHASERGVDYRRCSMIVFGGSGPIHGTRIARKLRIPTVVCPSGAGVMSAFGLLSSPLGFDLVQSHRVALSSLSPDEFRRIVASLHGRVRSQFAGAADDASHTTSELRLDMRYVGQGHEVEVTMPDRLPHEVFPQLGQLFGQAYAAIFGQSFPEKEVEIVAWKVAVYGPVPGGDQPYVLRGLAAQRTLASPRRRPAYFAEREGYVSCGVYDRYALAAGDVVEGPALVEEQESTCVLAPGDRGTVDEHLNLVITIAGAVA
jgi:N-methylhydantoinase A